MPISYERKLLKTTRMTVIVRNLAEMRLMYDEYVRFPLVLLRCKILCFFTQSLREFYVSVTFFAASFPKSRDKYFTIGNRISRQR